MRLKLLNDGDYPKVVEAESGELIDGVIVATVEAKACRMPELVLRIIEFDVDMEMPTTQRPREGKNG